MIKIFSLIFVLLAVTILQSCAYKTRFVSSAPSNPVIKKGHQTFHLNRFVRHAVVYEGTGMDGDVFRAVVSDSLRFQNDTLFALYGPEEYKARIDSFIYPGEQTVVVNKQVWQPIAFAKLCRIKSKRQPLSRISVLVGVVSYAAFLTGLIMATKSKDESTANKWGAMALAGDLGFFAAFPSNVAIAKKRFIFKKYRFGQRHRPLILL
jgi:hypothetical protein